MNKDIKMEDCLVEAIGKIETFITKATGVKPDPREIAAAMSKYFVLKEILAFVELERQEKGDG